MEELYALIGKDETILWSAKPDKKCFLLESVFNPFLPFALLWGLLDFSFIFIVSHAKDFSSMGPFLVVFFALHLMPVWIYLGGILFSYIRYKHTAFIITNKAVYTSSGAFSVSYRQTPLTDIKTINIQRGWVDNLLGVGDVELLLDTPTSLNIPESFHSSRGQVTYNIPLPNQSTPNKITICDIPDFRQVYAMLQEAKTGNPL